MFQNSLFLIIFLLLLSPVVKSQDNEQTQKSSNWDLAFEGMAGFSVGENIYSFNVGGPSFFLVLNPDLKVGLGAIPSFYFLNGRPGARLGVDPRVNYKRIAFIAPFYHRDTTDEWIWSVGFGYKFHRKK